MGKGRPFPFQRPQRLLHLAVRFLEDGHDLFEHRVVKLVRGANQQLADVRQRDCRIRIVRHRRKHLLAHPRLGVLHQFRAELPGDIEKRRRLDLPVGQAQVT